MRQINVDGLLFSFADDQWIVTKYDAWKFYRNRWARMWNDIKAVDLLAVDLDRTGWLIEVKDYTRMGHDEDVRPEAIDLALVVAHKVFDTLAAMLPAKVNSRDDHERKFASSMVRTKRLRVVLHLEQPATRTRLRPRAIDPANIRQKLKQLLKPIDPHPAVVAINQMGGLGWEVIRP
jgi:hypothetical protein